MKCTGKYSGACEQKSLVSELLTDLFQQAMLKLKHFLRAHSFHHSINLGLGYGLVRGIMKRIVSSYVDVHNIRKSLVDQIT